MHRVILAAPDGYDVDHIDGDGLNCLKSNMRIATRSENSQNHRSRINNTSGVKGVYLRRGKWQAEIVLEGRKFVLGSFTDINDAAKAYADASARLHGEFGRLS